MLIEHIVNDRSSKSIANYNGVTDCSAFYPSITKYYSNNKDLIPFLRVNEIQNGLVKLTDETIFLPLTVIEQNNKTIAKCYPSDIVIAKGGNSLAKVGLVTDEYPIYATSRDIIILRTNKLEYLNKYYLWAFLHSNYGQILMWKSASMTGQPHLTLPIINNMHIPDVSEILQELVENIYRMSVNLEKQAKFYYEQAEELLNKELNITNIENTKPYSIRSFSNSFGKSKRLDAEYYQDKYDQIVNRLKTKLTLSNICHIYDENFNPLEKGIYKYVELSDIYSNGEIREPTEYFGNELPTRARRKIDNGQVLVSSIEGSLSSCALVTDYDSSNLICSNGFYVVDSDTINSETLLVLFKSQYIQMLLKQRCSGTILTAISDDEFKNLPFIQIDEQVQDKIAQKVQESFRLRKQSKDLLEKAVKAVDIAIEQGEEKAIAWLNENTSE